MVNDSGAREQGIIILPQITERDLGLDYKSLSRWGWEPFNTNQQLEHLNNVFFDKTMAKQMLDQHREGISRLKQNPNPSNTETFKIDALGMLGKFLDYASRGNSESALFMLKQASTKLNQHKIKEASNILDVEKGQPFFNTPAKKQAAEAFFELSRIMYASANKGNFYESDAAQQRLEEQKARMRNTTIR